MKRQSLANLYRYAGDPSAILGIRDYVFSDGRAKGLRAFDVENGQGLRLTVLADRGLDIPFLSFKGINMSFFGKPGLNAPQFYVEDGVRGFLTRFYGGMLTTCGISYAGAPCEDDGRKLGLHGPYNNTPAEQVGAWLDYEGDDVVFHIRGQVREACVFGEMLRLSRLITVETETNTVRVQDTVENLGFDNEPVMPVYHVNFGYPMLDAGAKLYSNAKKIVPRDEIAAAGLDRYAVMEEPEPLRDEQCYFHTDFDGEGIAVLHNEHLGIAGIVRFDPNHLPLLCEWKCMRAGDYALGLEPTAAGVMGRAYAREHKMLRFLAPGESANFGFSLTFTDDPAEIAQYTR